MCVCVCERMEAGPEPTLQKVRQLDKARGRLDAWRRRKTPAIDGESSDRNFNRNVQTDNSVVLWPLTSAGLHLTVLLYMWFRGGTFRA